MVRVNLLPDVKREYLHAQQTKHAVIIASVLVSVGAIAMMVLLFVYVQLIQPQHRANIQEDIDSSISQIKGVPDAVKIVTVQGALEQLPALQSSKNISSRVFTYIKGFTPRSVAYSEVTLNLNTGMLTLRGATDDLKQSNVLANNIKSAELTYTQGDAKQKIKPFSKVVFSSLGRAESTAGNRSVNFQVDFLVNPIMFNESIKDIKLSVDAASKELIIPTAKPFVATQAPKEQQ